MPRANDHATKMVYRGNADDFVIFVNDIASVHNWRRNRSIPLAEVVSGWKVFVTHKHGAQGVLDGASKGMLESEFGTSRDEDVVTQILERGELQPFTAAERQGDTNVVNAGAGR